jgi:hypothetical protein
MNGVCFALIAVVSLDFLAERAETSGAPLRITSCEGGKRFESFFSLRGLIAHVYRLRWLLKIDDMFETEIRVTPSCD